jgi:hypothetical protein
VVTGSRELSLFLISAAAVGVNKLADAIFGKFVKEVNGPGESVPP